MLLVQMATAVAIGAYVVLSKDARHRRPRCPEPVARFMAACSCPVTRSVRGRLLPAARAGKVALGGAMLLIAIATISSGGFGRFNDAVVAEWSDPVDACK